MKETIFIGTIAILFIFFSFYYVANPTFVFPMTVGIISALVIEAIIIVIALGIRVLGSGMSSTVINAVAIIGTTINILFGLRIEISSAGSVVVSGLLSLVAIFLPRQGDQIIIGLGLLYPTAYDIFVVSGMGMLGYIGFIFISGISILALVSGMLIAFGGGSGD